MKDNKTILVIVGRDAKIIFKSTDLEDKDINKVEWFKVNALLRRKRFCLMF